MNSEKARDLTILTLLMIVGWLFGFVSLQLLVLVGIIVTVLLKNPELLRNKLASGLCIKREIDLLHHKTNEEMSTEYLKHVMQKIFFIRDIQWTENKVTARSLINFYAQADEPDCSAEIVGNKLIVSGPRNFCKRLTIKLIGRIRASIVMEE